MINLSELDNYFEIAPGQTFTANQIASFVGNGVNVLSMANEENQLRAYNECSPLKSIVSKRAKAFNNARLSIVNKNTGKPAQGQSDVISKINRPNPIQSRRQFFAQQNTYLDLFGWCPLLITRPTGRNDQITNIWNIPPWLLDIKYATDWIYQTKVENIYTDFQMMWSGQRVTLPANDLKILFDEGFGTENDMNLTIPDSRLKGLEYDISTILAAKVANNTIITKKGALGILSYDGGKDAVGPIPMREGEKQSLQNEFKRYGIAGQEWQVIISESNLNWQQMGYPVKDLMLLESIQSSVMAICDTYGYPYRLLSQEKAASYNDVKEFGKILYQDAIIPESESRLEQYSNAIFGDQPFTIIADFTHVPILQDDKTQAAAARKTKDDALEKEFKNNVITLNEWRIEICKDAITNGEKYYTELLAEGYSFGNTTLGGGDTQPSNGVSEMQIVA